MSKIHVGIIGTSQISEEHIKVINKINDFKLYGITSKTNKKCNYLKKKYNFERIYRNYNEMIIDDKIDTVVVSVPPQNNFKVLKDIIPHKKPFFTEKPVGINIFEHKKILKLVNKYKNLNMVGFNRRHYSIFHKALEKIDNLGGLIGFNIEGHERFWLKKDLTKTQRDNWHHINSVHTIDLINFFGGNIDKKYLVSKKTILKKNDNIGSIISFKNGIIGSYQSFWHSPGGWKIKLYGKGITAEFSTLETGYTVNNKFIYKEIIPSKYDKIFKPGFYKQMISFKDLLNTSKLSWPSMDISQSIHTSYLVNFLSNG